MLDAPVQYGGVDFNTVVDVGNGMRSGCLLEQFDYGASQGVGYTQKRSQDDGMDASDVYMGQRRIDLIGTVYGQTIAELFDKLQDIRTVLTPTVAYALDAPDHGFIPLTFSLPTMDSNFPSAAGDGTAPYVRDLEFRARPLGQPQFSIRRDTGAFNGEGSGRGGAITWRASLMCADPRMYVRPDIWVPFTGPVTGAPIVNRGDYPAPLDILLGIASSPAGGYLQIDVGGSNMNIGLNALTNAVVRYSGTLKVLTLQLSGANTDTLRMDMLSFLNNTTHPKVQAQPSMVYNVRLSSGVVLASGTRLMYSESFA
jgi:hypothetical protein